MRVKCVSIRVTRVVEYFSRLILAFFLGFLIPRVIIILFNCFTTPYIYNTYIRDRLRDKYSFARIVVVESQVVIDYDDDITIIMTKGHSDSVRLYNKLQELATKHRQNRILWSGVYLRSMRKYWEDKIIEKTGWKRRNVWRK